MLSTFLASEFTSHVIQMALRSMCGAVKFRRFEHEITFSTVYIMFRVHVLRVKFFFNSGGRNRVKNRKVKFGRNRVKKKCMYSIVPNSVRNRVRL